MTPSALEGILSIESVFEKAFQSMLMDALGNDVFLSRETRTATTPYVVVKMVMDTVDDNHQHTLTGQRWISDVWQLTLKVTVVTQREQNGAQHTPMIGQIRTLFQRRSFKPAFKKTGANNTHELVDMRERNSQDSEDDDDNLDMTEMNWLVVASVRNEAWPIGT